MNAAQETFLKHLLSQPIAPYRETHSTSAIITELERHDVPYFLDPIGNVVVGVSSKAEYLKLVRRKDREPVRLVIAHLDHPGFHGVSWKSPTELEVKWHGGSPVEHLDGAPVWLADEGGWVTEGRLEGVTLASHGKAIDRATVRLASALPTQPRPQTLFGAFRFRAPVWQEGDLLYTKAADDLVGSYAIVQAAIRAFGRSKSSSSKSRGKKASARPRAPRPPFLGLLTRAEEVGFIGAIGHFELGWLKGAKRPVIAVSLETSRQLPGAEIGKGPVVRLGDRATVFHSGALRVLSLVAEKALPQKHQRRIMDGGTCEATAATAYGISSIGISVPLGNYHNQAFEGGPDSLGPMGPAPEFVHLNDIEGMLALVHGLLQPGLPWQDPWANRRAEFRKSLKSAKKLLRG